MAIAPLLHIDVDEKGVARIVGSRIKVIHLVMCRRAEGFSVDEVQAQYPHLSLASVHAAFAYYYDHQAELDAQIREDSAMAEEWRRQAGESPIVARLRAEGKLA